MQRNPPDRFDAKILAFEGPAGTGVSGRGNSGRAAEADGGAEYIVELATHRVADPEFCLRWRALVLAGDSHQKIYQTPEFFQYQIEASQAQPDERMELLTICERSDKRLLGVVPVRLGRQELCFGFGKVMLYKTAVEMVNLMGSIPAVPGGAGLMQHLVQQLLAMFPQAKAVYMKSFPLHSEHWRQLETITAGPPLGWSLMGQWRDCHTLPLPATFEQYMEKFSAKKRYNLNRQIRQLGEQAGALDLSRVERPEQVAGLMDALGALLPAARLVGVLGAASFEALARRTLLLCYVLRAGDEVIAAVIGTRSPDAAHIHNIFVNKTYLSLSVGTTAMHLAIKDLMAEGCFHLVDFGYGTPNHDFRSSHVLQMRAQVVLFERKRAVRLLFLAHTLLDTFAEGMITRIKALRKSVLAMRRAKSA